MSTFNPQRTKTILFGEAPDDDLPETRLLKAILERAVDDLYFGKVARMKSTDASEPVVNRKSAQQWLLADAKRSMQPYGFLWVCQHLNVNPQKILRHLDSVDLL